MKVLVLNGSPAGEDSITLFTVKYWEKLFPDAAFETLHVGQRIRQYEKDFAPAREKLLWADLVLFCYPVYTFLVPAQLHRFVELMKESGVDFSQKYATQLTTSKHFYDVTAHRFIQDNCDDMGFRYLRGLSADMEDLLTERGRTEAEAFFRFVLFQMAQGHREPRRYGQEPSFAMENDYQQPKNFFGVGGLKIFRDLIYQMQGLMRADHRFYRAHGFYDDFPQRHRGRIAAMYLVGAMMKNRKLQRKIGGKMTEGMTLPYKKAIEAAEKEPRDAR